MTQSSDYWYGGTIYIYLGAPPLFRLGTFVFGMQLGRWALFEAPRALAAEQSHRAATTHRAIGEAKTLVPALATALVVTTLHGVLQPESEMHNPSTGSTPAQWALIHLIHPFNVLALVCGIIAAPHSLVARTLASPPLAQLAELSYAIYLLHYGIITAYVHVLGKRWEPEYERLQASADATVLDSIDYCAVVLLSTVLAYPVTHWLEPRVAAWLRTRVEPAREEGLL